MQQVDGRSLSAADRQYAWTVDDLRVAELILADSHAGACHHERAPRTAHRAGAWLQYDACLFVWMGFFTGIALFRFRMLDLRPVAR